MCVCQSATLACSAVTTYFVAECSHSRQKLHNTPCRRRRKVCCLSHRSDVGDVGRSLGWDLVVRPPERHIRGAKITA
jgi:hypothetical protein